MFTMLFTVGAGYFLYVNQANTVYTKALLARAGGISSQAEEALSLTTKLTTGGHISVYANNTGGIGVNITSLYLLGPSGATLECMGVGLPSGCTNGASFPVWVNVGGGSGVIDTGYAPASGDVYTIKVVTQRGSVFSATYPAAATSLAARALSSGAIGDLYLHFQSYTYYSVASCTSTLDGNSGYCLDKVGQAFTIPSSTMKAGPVAFSVEVTNLNQQQQNIVLDAYTLMLQFWSHSNSFSNVAWYILSNQTDSAGQNVIMATYSPLTLSYDKAVTLVFGSLNYGTFAPLTPNNIGTIQSDTTAAVFLSSHGWLGIPDTQTQNYGQNSPYVTTLYT